MGINWKPINTELCSDALQVLVCVILTTDAWNKHLEMRIRFVPGLCSCINTAFKGNSTLKHIAPSGTCRIKLLQSNLHVFL